MNLVVAINMGYMHISGEYSEQYHENTLRTQWEYGGTNRNTRWKKYGLEWFYDKCALNLTHLLYN